MYPIVKGLPLIGRGGFRSYNFSVMNADNDQYVDRGHQFQEEEEEEEELSLMSINNGSYIK